MNASQVSQELRAKVLGMVFDQGIRPSQVRKDLNLKIPNIYSWVANEKIRRSKAARLSKMAASGNAIPTVGAAAIHFENIKWSDQTVVALKRRIQLLEQTIVLLTVDTFAKKLVA